MPYSNKKKTKQKKNKKKKKQKKKKKKKKKNKKKQNIGLDTMILLIIGTELTIFGQLQIPVSISINLNLKAFKLLNCLHMIFLLCILRYCIILLTINLLI